MSTRLYGIFNFGKHRKLQAIRHVVSPSISASFSPDKAKYFNGWRTLTYTDKNGNEIGDSIDLTPCDYLVRSIHDVNFDFLSEEDVNIIYYDND